MWPFLLELASLLLIKRHSKSMTTGKQIEEVQGNKASPEL